VTANTTVPAAVIVGCIYIFSSLPIFAVARKLASQGTNQLAIKRERERERERDAANRVATHQCHCIKIIFVLGVDSCRCSSQAKKSFSQKSFVGNPCPAEMGVSPLSEEKILQI
jgi:hypothetical protein